MKILDHLSPLDHTSDAKTWLDGVQTAAVRLGFTRVLFGLAPKPDVDLTKVLIVSNFPEAWRHRYDRGAYARIDPTVIHALHKVEPVIWNDGIHKTPVQRAFREEAVAHGLANGVTFPLHGPHGEVGTFSFCIGDGNPAAAEKHIDAHLGDLLVVKEVAFQSALSRLFSDSPGRHIKLTAREKEVLKWCAIGKTAWEISKILHCSEATINFHLGNIRRKFGVVSSKAAAVRAIALRMISL